jgi:hypothetical protein
MSTYQLICCRHLGRLDAGCRMEQTRTRPDLSQDSQSAFAAESICRLSRNRQFLCDQGARARPHAADLFRIRVKTLPPRASFPDAAGEPHLLCHGDLQFYSRRKPRNQVKAERSKTNTIERSARRNGKLPTKFALPAHFCMKPSLRLKALRSQKQSRW